jgi:bifunctional UDP-N-acetylglucosamine pyrophosphorylase/glucosamine-1-phosphate N-acetyltransferase
MLSGVTLRDPNRFDLRGELIAERDIIIDVNVIFEGKNFIGVNSKIGPNNFLKNVRIGKNVEILANCVIENAEIGDNCRIGPFCRIRPDTKLDNGVHIGNFVELKKIHMRENTKAGHLAYLGDSKIGKDVNIGAGVITCNYDGQDKYQTIIEDGAFIGSDTQLVAPVIIGKNAYIGSGSTITKNAPPNKLTLGRAKQVTIENWKPKKKNDN